MHYYVKRWAAMRCTALDNPDHFGTSMLLQGFYVPTYPGVKPSRISKKLISHGPMAGRQTTHHQSWRNLIEKRRLFVFLGYAAPSSKESSMASKTPGKDRPSGGRNARPSLTERVMAALVPPLLDAWADALQAASPAARGVTRARLRWEDAVDMNAAAPPFRKNPSSWSHRIPIAVLAALGALVAAYLSLYELHLSASVWDPVFGAGTERVLTSELSERIYRIFHVPDTLLGALAYGTEILFTLAGSTRRWQYRPWIVALFGLNVLALAGTGVALVVAQGLVVKSWCFLCLVLTAISLLLAALSAREVYASLSYLRRVHRRSGRVRVVWNTFWGRASEPADRAALPKE